MLSRREEDGDDETLNESLSLASGDTTAAPLVPGVTFELAMKVQSGEIAASDGDEFSKVADAAVDDGVTV